MPVVLDNEMAQNWLNNHLEVQDFIEDNEYFEALPLSAFKR